MGLSAYLHHMFKAFEFCLPTKSTIVPAAPTGSTRSHTMAIASGWSDGNRVRLISRNGNDWTGRYPWIAESALKNRQKQFVIDGEAVVLGIDGIPDFNALHSRRQDEEVQLYAFDILALDGEDLRGPATEHAQDQSGAAVGAAARWHLRRALRAGRDRAGPLSRSLQHGP
jgi:bifunctional non-homologous end joining protein LigD